MNTEQTFAVSGDECVVSVETTVDDVVVRGWSRAQVGVDAPSDAINVQQNGMNFAVRPVRDGAGDFEVYVPQGCRMMLHQVSGDAEIRDLEGDISVQTMSGDVEARNLKGSLAAKAVSGDIEVKSSDLRAITVEAVSGDTLIESALYAEGDYHARSISGNLILRVPEDQRCTILCRTLSGDVKTKLPHVTKRQGWGKVEVAVNGGGVEFDVTSTSGDVKVEAADEVLEATDESEELNEVHEHAAHHAPHAHETRPLQAKPVQGEPFHVDAESTAEPSRAEQRMRILKAIELGDLSVEQGLAKLREI